MNTAVSPDLRAVWRGARVWLALLVLLVVAGAVFMLLTRGGEARGNLDPESYEPSGSHALAKLLTDAGVTVRPVHTLASAEIEVTGGTSLLVSSPELVPTGGLSRLRLYAADIVLVVPGPKSLEELLPGAGPVGRGQIKTLTPRCSVPAAVAAREATLGGVAYHAPGGKSCYPSDDGPTMVQVSDGPVTTTLLGTPAPLTNERLAEEGNAALSMRLLGQHQKLVWYLPSPTDPALDSARKSIFDLIPRGWYYGAYEVLIAVALLALWRARRLGPVVTEPLPIVVRAAETAEGRARLYRRAKASGHAGETLREASRARLRTALGLPRDAEAASLVASVSARTGRQPNEIGAVLYGPQPADDPALVRLADELDRVEREVGS